MRTLIVFATTHGCTESVVNELKEMLSGEVETINLKKDPNPSVADFDRVIIGGSIHAGQIQRRVKDFCQMALPALGDKQVGLFVCCMYEGAVAREQLQNAFPEDLHQMAKTEAIFGGEFDFRKMNFVERMLVKKIAHVSESVSRIDHKAIDRFVAKMEKTFSPFMFLI
jgi:menaquinone-dependent protoporphyrinogen oxidase